MRQEIKEKMEKEIQKATDAYCKCCEENIEQLDETIERIKANAQAESDRLDLSAAGEATFAIYESELRAGFTEKQAFELTKIIVANETKRTLF